MFNKYILQYYLLFSLTILIEIQIWPKLIKNTKKQILGDLIPIYIVFVYFNITNIKYNHISFVYM